MAEYVIAWQSNQDHTRNQHQAGSVCGKGCLLSTQIKGKRFGALRIPQLLLHNNLNTNKKWEPAGSVSLAGFLV